MSLLSMRVSIDAHDVGLVRVYVCVAMYMCASKSYQSHTHTRRHAHTLANSHALSRALSNVYKEIFNEKRCASSRSIHASTCMCVYVCLREGGGGGGGLSVHPLNPNNIKKWTRSYCSPHSGVHHPNPNDCIEIFKHVSTTHPPTTHSPLAQPTPTPAPRTFRCIWVTLFIILRASLASSLHTSRCRLFRLTNRGKGKRMKKEKKTRKERSKRKRKSARSENCLQGLLSAARTAFLICTY